MNNININPASSASASTEVDMGTTSHSTETNETNGYATNRSEAEDDNIVESQTSLKPRGSLKKPFKYPEIFLLRIPKADLHAHLDGSIRIPTLIDLARQYNVSLPSYDPEELKQLVFPETYTSLEEYLRGFGYITAVLTTPEALERVAYEVAMDSYNVGESRVKICGYFLVVILWLKFFC